MTTYRFERPKFLAWLFFLGAFATTAGLGTWQVQRLAWKENLIATIEHAKTSNPLTLKDLPTDDAGWKEKNFWPVKLTGTWDSSIEYHLTPRYFKGQMGYELIQPLQLANGSILLVNRGWVPAKKKDISTRPRSIGVGKQTITGLVRYGNERSTFTPKNQPTDNIWFGRDVRDMAALHDLKNVLPAMVDATGTQDINTLPIPSTGTVRLRNDHLSYIITWYGIALSILVIFVLSHRRKS